MPFLRLCHPQTLFCRDSMSKSERQAVNYVVLKGYGFFVQSSPTPNRFRTQIVFILKEKTH